jgi:uncharacterized protein YciI
MSRQRIDSSEYSVGETRHFIAQFTSNLCATLRCGFDQDGKLARARPACDTAPNRSMTVSEETMSEQAAAAGKREQCWVINNELVDPPPALALSKEELTARHHDFIHELEAKGLLVGAGPFLDDTGNRFGTGMIIFRAATRPQAEAIANREPYIAHGVRRLKLVPWQRIAGQ